MSKRCELQKEYYQVNGNYKGNGKYCDKYVFWLENEVLALTLPAVRQSLPTAKMIAIFLHDNYEDIARQEGWETQKSTRVSFFDLPEANKKTMIKTAERLRDYFINKSGLGGNVA